MSHADALSRAPVQGIQISSWPPMDFKELQDLDSGISVVKGWVQAENAPHIQPKDCSPVFSVFYITFDSLFAYNSVLDRQLIVNIERSQIVIPKFSSQKILHHTNNQIGHFGIRKTFDMFHKRFHWPGFLNDVGNSCKSFQICIKNKVFRRPRKPKNDIDSLAEIDGSDTDEIASTGIALVFNENLRQE